MFREMVYSFLASGAGSHASPRRPYGRTPAIGRMDLPGGAALERSDPTRCVSGQTSSARRWRTVVCWPALFRLAYDRGATVHR